MVLKMQIERATAPDTASFAGTDGDKISTKNPPSAKELKIDPDIQFLCRPLEEGERSALEKDIETHGCLQAIIYWEGQDIIVDGHNRYEICNRIGKPYECKPMSFESKEDAMNWVIDHQLGRRNLSTDDISYLRGKRYITEKKVAHRPSDKELHQSDGVPGETAKRIAEQTGVSQATIERDARHAEAIDKLREEVSEDFGKKVLSRKVKLSKQDIIELSKSEDKKALAAEIEKGKKLSEAKQIVKPLDVVSPEAELNTPKKPEQDERIVKAVKHLRSAFKSLNGVRTADRVVMSDLMLLSKQITKLVMAIAINSASPDKWVNNPSNECQIDPDSLQGGQLEIPGADYQVVQDP